MPKKKKIDGKNYLDFTPVHNEAYQYKVAEDGKVTIFVENKGFFNKIAQMFFKRPRISQIHLDDFGNFIWPYIDGKHTVLDISVVVKERFGDAAEPLYPRLVQYMNNLEMYGFIVIDRK